jgi:aryl-alcohol dehydrogenase-like predicted oxidoreductase
VPLARHRVRAFLPARLAARGAERIRHQPHPRRPRDPRGSNTGQIALAWLLDLTPNILLIPGTRTRAHLAENIHAAGVRLDDAARVELARFPDARS